MVIRGWRRSGGSGAAALAAAALLLSLLAPAPVARAAEARRFALVVGNDDGGSDTRALYYAARDAERVHGVLTDLGRVRREDAVLLTNRTAGDVLGALAELERRSAQARGAGARTVLILYYSGHAKDGILRMGGSRVALGDLKTRLQSAAADVKVGIFDSCRSGVPTRTKGARRAPAFEIESSSSEDTHGVVFLSSSSADEDAQESDEIGGSYFSHNLVVGLAGPADRSRDERVTLSEAYAYAYARTVADTAESAAGPQHPTFSYDLKGNGDLVLADLGARREGLHVPASAPAATYYIVRQGFIAAEVTKPAGEDRRIALAPGRYTVKRRLPDRLRIGEVVVAGGFVTLDESRLRDAPFSDDPVKGVRRDPGSRFALALSGSFQSFFDEPTREGLFPPTGLVGIELTVHDFFRRGWSWGVDLGLGSARAELVRHQSVSIPFKFAELSLGTSLVTEWSLMGGRLAPFVGGRLAFLFMSRHFEETAIPIQSFSTFSPGVVGGLRVRLSSRLSAVARARLHYLLYNVDENRSLGYWELAAALSVQL